MRSYKRRLVEETAKLRVEAAGARMERTADQCVREFVVVMGLLAVAQIVIITAIMNALLR